jgi:hypothetical protein
MPFREKSAWLMVILLTCVGIAYYALVAKMSAAIGQIVPPLIPLLIAFTIVLAILATGSHILIALLAPKDAVARADERDRAISARAGAWSGYVFAAGIALALGLYLLVRNGDLLFHCVFGSWVLAQLSEYAFEISLYRRRAP